MGPEHCIEDGVEDWESWDETSAASSELGRLFVIGLVTGWLDEEGQSGQKCDKMEGVNGKLQ